MLDLFVSEPLLVMVSDGVMGYRLDMSMVHSSVKEWDRQREIWSEWE